MTTEKIEIRELYEFQLFERGPKGEPTPVGEPIRSLDRVITFDDEQHGIVAGRWYALKRRRVEIDTDGFPAYGKWSKLTEWKRPTVTEVA